jgi:CubicO group peptidase (beta-lactamase class C family)
MMVDFQDAAAHLTAVIEQQIQSLNLPGLAIGVTDRERTLFVGNYGFAHCEAQQVVTPQTLFQIGSISKSFASIVLLQLQEQGLLNLDDPVSNFLPWFQIQTEYAPFTLRQLMSHTAGIIMGTDATQSAYTEAWGLRWTKTAAPPGEIFHYSNSGYKILGLVIQAVLKQNLADILQARILTPLGMFETEPAITHAIRPRLAVGYEPFYDDRPLPRGGKLAPAPWIESDTADGSISSTAADMCRYLRALLNRAAGLLTSNSFEQLIQPLIPTSDELHGEHYGLGLSTRLVDGHHVIGHSGGMVGYTADMIADLDSGLGVVVLSNGPGNPETVSQYTHKLLRAAQERADDPYIPFPDLYHVENAHQYAGQYRCGEKTFTLVSRQNHLFLEDEGDTIRLEPQGEETFLVPHPSFQFFLMRFERDQNSQNEQESPIIAAFHGPERYLHSRFQGRNTFEIPREWSAYTGHYRAHNPWLTNFRVVIQKDALVLIGQWEAFQPLHQTAPGTFRVGSEPHSPEFIIFDLVIDGKAMRANLSGGVYCRTFTP